MRCLDHARTGGISFERKFSDFSRALIVDVDRWGPHDFQCTRSEKRQARRVSFRHGVHLTSEGSPALVVAGHQLYSPAPQETPDRSRLAQKSLNRDAGVARSLQMAYTISRTVIKAFEKCSPISILCTD